MPISVISASQHHANFKRFQKPQMKLLTVHNFTNIKGIFSLPVCALIARKGESTTYPVKQIHYSKINDFRMNSKLATVKKFIKQKSAHYSPPLEPPKESWSEYFRKAIEGATFVPRNCWFVDFEPHPELGFDTRNPYVKTSQEIIKHAKDKYEKIILSDPIESEYIQATMEGRDLIPFGSIKYRPIFLPLEKKEFYFDVLDVQGLRYAGKNLAAKWLENNQKLWEQLRTEKSGKSFPRIINRIDYGRLIRNQDPTKGFAVVWNGRGADAMAHVVKKNDPPIFTIGKYVVRAKNIVFDYTCHYINCDNEDEAHYLCSILNSDIANQAVKPFQPRGNFGHRDIGRRTFMLPVPTFDKTNEEHKKLVVLSKKCHTKIQEHRFETDTFKAMRNEALRQLKVEVYAIDKIVKKILV